MRRLVLALTMLAVGASTAAEGPTLTTGSVALSGALEGTFSE